MKLLSLILLALLVSTPVRAGQPGCTDVTNISGDFYLAGTDDCVIRVSNDFSFTSSVVALPDGGTFTVESDSAFAGDDCEDYGDPGQPFVVCSPRSITIVSVTGHYTVDSAVNGVDLAGFYIQGSPARNAIDLSDDGVSNWTGTYYNWR